MGEQAGALAIALLRKTGTGRALTWPRVSLLLQERPELNGPFMGQWEASRLAVIPHPPPCPAWGPCCPTPFTVYPGAGKYRHVVPGSVSPGARHLGQSACQPPPRAISLRALALPRSARLPSPFAQFPPLGRCGCIPFPRRTSEPGGRHPCQQVLSASGPGIVLSASHFSAAESLTLRQPHCAPGAILRMLHTE